MLWLIDGSRQREYRCELGNLYIEVLLEIVRDRSEADRRKLFAENAAGFYGLPLQAGKR